VVLAEQGQTLVRPLLHPKLPNLDGLNKLAFIAGMLEISNNDTLTNLDGRNSPYQNW